MKNLYRPLAFSIKTSRQFFIGKKTCKDPCQFITNCWQHYYQYNPKVIPLLQTLDSEDMLKFDHLAIRTIDFADINLKKISAHLLEYGYKPSGKHYPFPALHLEGTHFEPPHPQLPKIFASQLLSKHLSPTARNALTDLVSAMPPSTLASANLFYFGHADNWLPNYDTYLALLNETNYGAWLYANGYIVNHFAVDVSSTHFPSVASINTHLKSHQYQINMTQGKEIEGSPEVFLEQSSTKANKTTKLFRNDIQAEIYTTFVEFIQRYKLENGEQFGNFLPESAQNIFTSTFEEKEGDHDDKTPPSFTR